MTSDVSIQQLWNILHREVVVQYPYRTAGVLFLWSYYPQFPFHVLCFGLCTLPLNIVLFPFYLLFFVFWVVPCSIIGGILACLGFRRAGVKANSFASKYQSRRYGGHTPRNSIFSKSQSYGATHTQPIWALVGWLLFFGSLVVLLKYGLLRTK